MTPAARLSAAIEVLDQYLSGSAAEKALTNWARRSRFAGSKDRAAVRDIVFDCLRKRSSFAARGNGLTGRGLVFGHAQGAHDQNALHLLFSGEGHAPAKLSPKEEDILNSEAFMDREAIFDMPQWVIEEVEASLGDQSLAVANILRDRASVFLRVNLSKTSRESAINSLAKDGVMAVVEPMVNTALKVIENPRKVAASSAYLNGRVELQDVASQTLCAQLPAANRMLDFCAGGGGKVLAYGAVNKAKLYAHDANHARLRDLTPRAKRAGLKVEILDTQACHQHGEFDLVLCDVPCSGSGAWRRSPEGKWALNEGGLKNLLKTQQEILTNAMNLVAPEGVLAYATCSLFARENEAQIALFCAQNEGWSCTYERRYSPLEGGDGFYIAYLTRHIPN